jgi:hypothetical protein
MGIRKFKYKAIGDLFSKTPDTVYYNDDQVYLIKYNGTIVFSDLKCRKGRDNTGLGFEVYFNNDYSQQDISGSPGETFILNLSTMYPEAGTSGYSCDVVIEGAESVINGDTTIYPVSGGFYNATFTVKFGESNIKVNIYRNQN